MFTHLVRLLAGVFVAGLSVPTIALSQENTSQTAESPIEVVEGKSEIIVYQNGKARTLIVPPQLIDSSRYFIKLAKDTATDGELSAGQTSMDERVKAQKLLYEANQQFIKGNITKTWEMVDKAKQLDPNHYRIKTMEGSLLYQMGSKDLAFTRWQESLKQNPDQPELLAVMKEAQQKEGKK